MNELEATSQPKESINDRSSPAAIGERIARLRKHSELTQAKLAKLCQLSQQTIGALEAGRVSNPGSLPIIASVLNVSAEYLRYGRAKGVPILLNASRNEHFPQPGQDIDPAVKMLQTLFKVSPDAFAFRLDDNACQNLGIMANDYVVVEPASLDAVSPEKPVCVRYRGKLTVRRLQDMGTNFLYVSDNEMYAPLDDSLAELIGNVVQITRCFN